MRGINVKRRSRTAAENLDPMGKPVQPVPWYKLDPEEALDPWAESEEQKRDKTLWEMLTYPTCEDSSGRSIFESGDSRSAVRATEGRDASALIELVTRLHWEV